MTPPGGSWRVDSDHEGGKLLVAAVRTKHLIFLCFAWLVACGPAKGPVFRGDDRLQMAIFCESRAIHASKPYWMTVTVRRKPDIEVDWPSTELRMAGAVLAQRTSGRDEKSGAWVERMETFRVLGDTSGKLAPDQVNAAIGPFRLRWRSAGGPWQEASSESCDPGLEP